MMARFFIYIVGLTGLLMCIPAARVFARQQSIELKDGAVLQGQVMWVGDDSINITIDKDAVTAVDGKKFSRFEKKWRERMKQDDEAMEDFMNKFYKDAMRQRQKGIDVDREWENIAKYQSAMNEFFTDDFNVFGKQSEGMRQVEYTKNDVYRKYTDGKQSYVDLLKITGKYLRHKRYFFYIDEEGNLSNLFTGESSHAGTSYEELEKMLRDKDQDGVADAEEVCEEKLAMLGAIDDLPTDCITTDPAKQDTDGDGWWDGFERVLQTDPNDPDSVPDPQHVGSQMFNSTFSNVQFHQTTTP